MNWQLINKPSIQIAAALLLVAGTATAFYAWQHAEDNTSRESGLPQPMSRIPVAANPGSEVVTPDPAIKTDNEATVAPARVAEPEPIVEPEAAIEPESVEPEDADSDDQSAKKPSPETIQAMREMKKPTADEGQIIQNADGSQEMKLGNRYQSVPVATVGKDGKVHVDYHGEKYIQEQKKQETPQP